MKRRHPLAFFFLLALAAAYAYAIRKAPVAVVGTTVVLVVIAVVLTAHRKRQLTHLAEGRTEESICTFAREFDLKSTDPWVVRAVYEQLEAHLKSFGVSLPIRPGDRLREDLRLDDDDLDLDLAREIATRTGRSLAHPKENPHFGKVLTVRDLVEYFCAQPKRAT